MFVQCTYRGDSDEYNLKGIILGYVYTTEIVALVAIPSNRIVPITLDRIKVDVKT